MIVTVRGEATVTAAPSQPQERMVEWTVESREAYTDPFNDVDLDVVFSKGAHSWRVPAFWRGGQKWTVRFAPPAPGEYTYRLESTDPNNGDLNGQEGQVRIIAYSGSSEVLRHGALRVSANKRYFEYADGTPFYWLGDTWWTGLSSRLSWDGFQTLTADRKAKGFTVIQISGGLIPSNEELAPVDPGFCNEGGCVWDLDFKRINPQYFDFADRRIQHLLDNNLVPAIFGAWSGVLGQMGVAKLKRHWRYLIARYGPYPVFWAVAGEVLDPPEDIVRELKAKPGALWAFDEKLSGGWSEVARYLRATDPYAHPVSVHEMIPDYLPLQEESLTDFKMSGPSHYGWSSIAVEVAQISAHYARTAVRKPIVQSEMGYEKLGETHLEDFQRTAFWLAMLNGAAGHTYGANGTWEAYTGDKPLHRWRHSFMTWEEGMRLPGSYQIGLGAKLLRQFAWWRFEPHPEWVSPRGTTFLEPREDGVNRFRMNLMADWDDGLTGKPIGEWTTRQGDFRLPYAAGIAGEVRVIYFPSFGLVPLRSPTIFALEKDVRYHAYYWEPSSGTQVDLGVVEHAPLGEKIREDHFAESMRDGWTDVVGKTVRENGVLRARGEVLTLMKDVSEKNPVVAVGMRDTAEAGVVLRYRDPDNYLAALYSAKDKSLYLLDRREGRNGDALGVTSVPEIGRNVRLTIEAKDDLAIASLSDGSRTYTTPIVDVKTETPGAIGLATRGSEALQQFHRFEVRRSPPVPEDAHLNRELRDAKGFLRGELKGTAMTQGPIAEHVHGYRGWDGYGRRKNILLNAYRPERLPTCGDWVLVLATEAAMAAPTMGSMT